MLKSNSSLLIGHTKNLVLKTQVQIEHNLMATEIIENLVKKWKSTLAYTKCLNCVP